MEQITTILILLVESAALIMVLTWPAVKGKVWLVGALLTELSSVVCALILHITLAESGQIVMGVDEYQQYVKFTSFLYGLQILGKIFFVIAVIRLRTPLKQFVERV